ncbi:uncharacterized protein [Periplaneta americana]|uniref:uncharacterized protein isoform X1 n=1 Tax=Periplaneta americana TaxID=6978 RepID=UPI0037E8ABB2
MKFFVGLLFSIIIAVVTAAPSEKSSQQRMKVDGTRSQRDLPGPMPQGLPDASSLPIPGADSIKGIEAASEAAGSVPDPSQAAGSPTNSLPGADMPQVPGVGEAMENADKVPGVGEAMKIADKVPGVGQGMEVMKMGVNTAQEMASEGASKVPSPPVRR